MLRTVCHRKLALPVVFCLALLAPLTVEALPLDRALAAPLAGVMSRLTEWFTTFLGDVGCSMDPGGGCHDANVNHPPAASETADVGCSMDPGGACGERG